MFTKVILNYYSTSAVQTKQNKRKHTTKRNANPTKYCQIFWVNLGLEVNFLKSASFWLNPVLETDLWKNHFGEILLNSVCQILRTEMTWKRKEKREKSEKNRVSAKWFAIYP
jgi:hypothetical protein